jgi:hypothetical protein
MVQRDRVHFQNHPFAEEVRGRLVNGHGATILDGLHNSTSARLQD